MKSRAFSGKFSCRENDIVQSVLIKVVRPAWVPETTK